MSNVEIIFHTVAILVGLSIGIFMFFKIRGLTEGYFKTSLILNFIGGALFTFGLVCTLVVHLLGGEFFEYVGYISIIAAFILSIFSSLKLASLHTDVSLSKKKAKILRKK